MNFKKFRKKIEILGLALFMSIMIPVISNAQENSEFKFKEQPVFNGEERNNSILEKYLDLKKVRSINNENKKIQGISEELLENNGFESGHAYWTEQRYNTVTQLYDSNSNIIFEDNLRASSGDWFAWLDGYDYIKSNTATLPNYATSVNLSYDKKFAPAGTCDSGGNYILFGLWDVTVNGAIGVFEVIVANVTPIDIDYVNESIDIALSGSGGHQVRIDIFGNKDQEACNFLLYLDNVSLTATISTDSIYRFWSASKQGHFYTRSATEKDNIIANDLSWNYEGVAYDAFASSHANTVPIHRFWSASKQHHFFTASQSEKEFIEANDSSWAYEGIAYYAYSSSQPNSTPIHRFWSASKQGHFFTKSETEKNNIIANDSSWSYEGIAWYVPNN